MADWHDPFHIKAKEAIRFVSAALRVGGVSGNILLGGDSASAFCADSKKEMTLKNLWGRSENDAALLSLSG